MKTLTRIFSALLLGAMLLAACAPSTTGSNTPTQSPAHGLETVEPTAAVPTPQDAPLLPPAAALAAQKALADELGVGVEVVTIAQVEQTEFSDSCLGLGGPAESCLQAITPGFVIVLVHGGKGYTYHADLEGSVLRLKGASDLQSTGGQEQVVQAVAEALAQYAKVDLDQIKLLSFDQQEWSDSCLGLGRPDEICAQVITPGYEIAMLVGNVTYKVHTNLTGSAARLEDGTDLLVPKSSTATGVVFSFQTGGQLCRELQATLTSVQTGPCGGPFEAAKWPATQRVQELEVMLQSYTQSDFDSPAGTISLQGEGGRAPSENEQKSLLTWANQLMHEISAGKANTTTGRAIIYHRSGGLMGLCEDVFIYETGFAWNMSCAQNSPEITGVVRLNDRQLQTLQEWQAQFDTFEFEQKDNATADGMTSRIEFTGNGSTKAALTDQLAMGNLAVALFHTAAQY